MVIVGTILWIMACLLALRPNSSFTLNNYPVQNPVVKIVIMVIVFPLLGLLFKLVGLLGDLMVAPVAHLLGLS